MTTAAEHLSETPTAPSILAGDDAARPVHVAFCPDCEAGVKYRLTQSGSGLIVLERYKLDIETTFGQADNTVPICPNCDIEMQLKDETLVPAAEAFEQVGEQLQEPVQRSLPGVVPVFNFQGAYQEIEAKAVEVDVTKRQYDHDAKIAKESKSAWETAANTLNKMILEFRRRRREKAEGPTSAGQTSEGPCRFEQLNPGVPCPICTDPMRPTSPEIRASESHGVEAKELLVTRELAACVQQLAAIQIFVKLGLLQALPMDDLSELQGWALDATQHPDERERWGASLPRGLGTPHVAPNGHTSEATDSGEGHGSGPSENYQSCTVCGARLSTLTEGDWNPYPPGALVGVDCAGAEQEPARQLPRRKKAKAQKK